MLGEMVILSFIARLLYKKILPDSDDAIPTNVVTTHIQTLSTLVTTEKNNNTFYINHNIADIERDEARF